jgi:lipid A disaccharide synthetase
VRKIFPIMIETARQLLQVRHGLHFQVAAASEELAREMKIMLTPHLNPLPSEGGEDKLQAACTDSGSMSAVSSGDHKQPTTGGDSLSSSVDAAGTPLPLSRGEGRVRGESSLNPQVIQIKVGETAEIMQRAWAGIVASGSATLEAAYFRMPFVLVYKVAWPTYVAARAVVNVNYLGMPNLLADKEVVPEFIQQQAKPNAIARAMGPLIEDVQARQRMISAFDAIISKLGGGGATEHAAQAILEELKGRRSPSRPGAPEAAAS